jgi:hypothetical protein
MTANNNPEKIRQELQDLVVNFKTEIKSGDLRAKVLSLVSCYRYLREIGKSLMPEEKRSGARTRILSYFKKYPFIVINGDELLVISGIQEWARRIRELRVQFGWSIINGITIKQIEEEIEGIDKSKIGNDDYILTNVEQDKEAAYRWSLANDIRRKKASVRDKIIDYLRQNVGKKVTGEELRYLAADKSEWPRRVRELRSEYGWPISTKNKGRPDLPVGVYLLEADRQSPEHDRHISDMVRVRVLSRDNYECQNCHWTHDKWNISDPRHLELHHQKPHLKGGGNEEDNLITVCDICHDDIHRKEKHQ